MTATQDPRVVTAATALRELIAGNERFVAGRPRHGHDVASAAATASGQQPHSLVLGCIDSRVPPEAVFDQPFGAICVARSGAHVLDRSVLGSINFAVAALGVAQILVLGHTGCGAVSATVAALRSADRPGGDVGYLVDELAPAAEEIGLHDPEVAEKAVRAHVARTVERLRADRGLAEAVAAGRVGVAGAVYDLATGRVDLLP